MAEWFNAPIY